MEAHRKPGEVATWPLVERPACALTDALADALADAFAECCSIVRPSDIVD